MQRKMKAEFMQNIFISGAHGLSTVRREISENDVMLTEVYGIVYFSLINEWSRFLLNMMSFLPEDADFWFEIENHS